MFSKVPSAILICVLVLAGCSERSGTGGQATGFCGKAPAPKSLVAASSLVKSDTPLYWVDDQGRLVVGGFDGRAPRVLHQRPFDHDPNLFVSPDGRWLLYGDSMQGKPTQQEVWLFDTRSGKITKVFDGPAHWLGLPAFSPDGRSVAFFNEYDDRWPTPHGAGLYLVDTERGQTDYIGPIDGSAISPLQMQASVEWSATGDAILLSASSRARGTAPNTPEYYAFSPATRKFRRIDAHVDVEARKTELSENGVKLTTLEQPRPRANTMYYERASPDGSLLARVDEKYQLVVTGAGLSKVIDQGDYNMCEGVTLLIVDWVDQNKYLVYYQTSGTFYIAEPTTGRKAALSIPGATMMGITW